MPPSGSQTATQTDDAPQPIAPGSTESQPRQPQGRSRGRNVVPIGQQVDDGTVRRRRGRSTSRIEAGAKPDDPVAGPGTAGTDGAVEKINHSGRFGTFPDPTPWSEDLVTNNMGLAYKVAWSWAQKTGLPYEDLESIAMMGLIRGCRKYDPSRINPGTGRPYALSSIACPYIHGELLHHFRDHPYAIRYPNAWRENYGKVQRMLQEQASHAQIAAATGLPEREVSELVETMTRPAELNHEVVGAEDLAPEYDLLGPLRQIVDLAFDDLQQADRVTLCRWVESPRRTPTPSGPLQQFDKRFNRLLGGKRLPEFRQLRLIHHPPVQRAERERRRRRTNRVRVAVGQLVLAV